MAGKSALDKLEEDLYGGNPVTDVLRRCLALGQRLGSPELRDWASRELSGYVGEMEVPDYRRIGAPLRIDFRNGSQYVTGYQLSALQLPDFAQGHLDDVATVPFGVGEIESIIAKAEKNTVQLSPPGSAELIDYFNIKAGPFENYTALYWAVNVSALQGVIEAVKNKLAELIGELQDRAPERNRLPSAEAADQAVNLVVKNARNTNITLTQGRSQATAGATESGDRAGLLSRLLSRPWWLGAGVLVSAWIGISAALHVPPF